MYLYWFPGSSCGLLAFMLETEAKHECWVVWVRVSTCQNSDSISVK